MSFGKRLKSLRDEYHVYQKQLADYLNVSLGTISGYEKDQNLPDASTLRQLADFFNVSCDYLLERTRYKQDTDILSHPLVTGYTISDFITMLVTLDREEQESVRKYLEYLSSQNHNTHNTATPVPKPKLPPNRNMEKLQNED